MLLAALLILAALEPRDDGEWRRLMPTQDAVTNFEYHRSSVQRRAGLVEVWARHDIRSFRGGQFILDGRNVWLSFIDCHRKLIRQVRGARRNLKGHLLPGQGTWDAELGPIVHGSIGAYLHKAVC